MHRLVTRLPTLVLGVALAAGAAGAQTPPPAAVSPEPSAATPAPPAATPDPPKPAAASPPPAPAAAAPAAAPPAPAAAAAPPAPAAAATPAPAAAAQAGAPQEITPSHLEAARELMVVTGVLAPLDDLMPSFGEEIRKQSVTRPELTKDLNEVLASLAPELELQKRDVGSRVARTYAKWLSEPELRELVAFFKTPVGAKYNKVQPDIVEEVVNDVGVWTQEVSEYVMIRTRAEMGKRGHQMQ